MTRWLDVDEKDIKNGIYKEEADFGVIYLSPFDRPKAAGIDVGSRHVNFYLKYIGGVEPLTAEEVAPSFVFLLGKNSGRVYRVSVERSVVEQSGTLDVSKSRVQLKEAFRKLIARHSEEKSVKGLHVADGVLNSRTEELVAEAIAALKTGSSVQDEGPSL